MAVYDPEQEPDALRVLSVGDSGSGKTGSLISLLEAGYTLRMMDVDNNVASLVELCKHRNPELLKRLDVMSFRDKFRASTVTGIEVSGRAKAWTDIVKALNKWDDDSVPEDWPRNNILVMDTVTSLGRAAFHWARSMNPTCKDPRQWYATAQDLVATMIEMITSKDFNPHVICMSHIDLVTLPDDTMKGYASTIGKAMGPKFPKSVSTMVLVESKGSQKNRRRTIQTLPTQLFDLKSPTPWQLEGELPIDTGMATIFEALTKKASIQG